MTLLISAKYSSGFVVTADGRSNKITPREQAITSDSLQKIFPHGKLPLAICHHGENVLAGKPVAEQIRDFLKSLANPADSDAVATKLLSYFDELAAPTLRENDFRKYCGFWILSGLGGKLDIHEVDWLKTPNGIVRRITPHGPLVIGGDCSAPIRKYLDMPINDTLSASKLESNEVEYAKRLANELYALVMAEGLKTCGGHKHQLQVTAKGTAWIVEPMEGG